MSIFKGAGVAIVTPMKENEEVNYEKLEELIDWQIAEGTDCIVIAGTTGESSTLTTEEHTKVIEAAVRFTAHRVPVVAGTGSNCTREAVHLSQEAELLALTADFVGRRAQEALDRCRLLEEASDGSAGPEEARARMGNPQECRPSPVKRIRIAVPAFLQEEKLLQTHLLRLVLKELSGGGKDIGMSHIRDVESLFYKQGGKRVMLPYGLEALRSFGEVIVQEKAGGRGVGRDGGGSPGGAFFSKNRYGGAGREYRGYAKCGPGSYIGLRRGKNP